MPASTEVDVFSSNTSEEELLEVQSDDCEWRILRSGFPSCQELGRCTSAMPLPRLYCDDPSWLLGSAEEGPAVVAKAAAWLSQIGNCSKELSLEVRPTATASTIGFVSSLAPFVRPTCQLAASRFSSHQEDLGRACSGAPQRMRAHLIGMLHL